MKLEFVKVEPIGTEKRMVLACPGARLVEADMPKYPASATGSALRALRVELGLSIGKAAAALEVLPHVISALEMGRLTLARSEDWALIYAALNKAAGR